MLWRKLSVLPASDMGLRGRTHFWQSWRAPELWAPSWPAEIGLPTELAGSGGQHLLPPFCSPTLSDCLPEMQRWHFAYKVTWLCNKDMCHTLCQFIQPAVLIVGDRKLFPSPGGCQSFCWIPGKTRRWFPWSSHTVSGREPLLLAWCSRTRPGWVGGTHNGLWSSPGTYLWAASPLQTSCL